MDTVRTHSPLPIRFARLWLLAWLTIPLLTARAASDTPSDEIAALRPEHPRLLAGKEDWNALLSQRAGDATLDRLLTRIEQSGRRTLSTPTLTYEKQGRRLLAVSRAALARISVWAFCHRLTGEAVFVQRAEKEMLALSAFPDWNPSHFLDTAEMTAALAIGYDWLHGDLSSEGRATIRRAIVDKGLRQAVGPEAKYTSWQRAQNNWNQVCFGGLTLGALAVADEEPELARTLLAAARKGIVHGLRPYAPDGVYPEGPIYWDYGTTYQVLMIAALQSALNDTWQLDESAGFLPSAAAQLQQTGPTGRVYNFADCSEAIGFHPALFWFARRLQQPELLRGQLPLLERILATEPDSAGGRFLPLIALWWSQRPDPDAEPALPLRWLGDGPNPIGVFRSSWTDPNALYLAFKGGSAQLAHAHMDAGSFVLEADGVRWACDLGAQDYFSIESKGWNLWDRGQRSDRWRIYRLNNFSHNTLTLDDQLHRVSGDARIVVFNADAGRATVDLTRIFADQATNVLRHFRVNEHREVVIRDELSGLKPNLPVRWQMVTRAQVDATGTRATLSQDGKTLIARLNAPAKAAFEVHPADAPSDGVNHPNPGARILAVTARASANGRLRIEIALQPGTIAAKSP